LKYSTTKLETCAAIKICTLRVLRFAKDNLFELAVYKSWAIKGQENVVQT
jgi:hypothetical protein